MPDLADGESSKPGDAGADAGASHVEIEAAVAVVVRHGDVDGVRRQAQAGGARPVDEAAALLILINLARIRSSQPSPSMSTQATTERGSATPPSPTSAVTSSKRLSVRPR
jgi:hypothetical protein